MAEARAGMPPTAIAVGDERKVDLHVAALVTVAHTTDHFLQLAVPPLFPLMKTALGVSYVELGLLMTAFYITSGLCQTVAGFLVDRWGPLRVLAAGLALISCAISLIGLAPHFAVVLPLMVIAGAGNSVFHPADYSLLTSVVRQQYIARAYGVHSFGGNLGWALAPVTVLALAAFGWRTALIIVGLGGLAIAALVLFAGRALLHGHAASRPPDRPASGMRQDIALLMVRPILLCFVYFALLSVALVGTQTFLPATLHALRGTDITAAGALLTAFLGGSAVGILIGGMVADWTRHHERVVAAGLAAAAALLLVVGAVPLPVSWLAVVLAAAGLGAGMTMPSRDMLARGATPPGATGKVFGFVYSGLDLGSAVAPVVLGFIVDRQAPFYVFVVSAVALVLAIAVSFSIKRSSAGRPERGLAAG